MSKVDFSYKRIADPVHGTIGLSELEIGIINTSVFQRLRNVRQLGLVNHVFPAADYSRFAHSVGVCHIAGLILNNLRLQGARLTDGVIQEYRLAALLHDVGHYPFSHAMETVVGDYYRRAAIVGDSSNTENGGGESGDQETIRTFYDHERVGREILENDPELSGLLREKGIDAKRLYSMILKEDESPQFANLVSSDLDADRTDYLLRTAHATGLPYGNVDLEYLISQIQVDQEDRLAVTPKALRTADHFLLSRYFDYQQVVFHKTVVGAELVLKDVLRRILKDGHIDCSSASVSKSITEGSWHTFDEVELTNVMRSLRGESSEDGLRLKLSSVLDRRPPKLVGEIEFLGRRDRPTISSHNLQTRTLKSAVPELASEFGIDEGVWYTWSKSMALTKLSATLPASAVVERCTDDEEEYEKLVRVIGQDGTSVPITDVPHSLMHILADYALYAIRVYVLFPDGLAEAQHRRSIRGRLMGRLPESDWK